MTGMRYGLAYRVLARFAYGGEIATAHHGKAVAYGIPTLDKKYPGNSRATGPLRTA